LSGSIETYLLQLFTYPETSESFSVNSGNISEVKLDAKQKRA